jgi:hypothetical protein
VASAVAGKPHRRPESVLPTAIALAVNDLVAIQRRCKPATRENARAQARVVIGRACMGSRVYFALAMNIYEQESRT